jgi:Holliday junction resolvasome RuvABC endonuclease subunit
MAQIHMLGIDPGLANIGYAVVTLSRKTCELVRDRHGRPLMGALHTEQSAKKREVRASDDRLRRAREIALELNTRIFQKSDLNIRVISAEAMSFPPSASVAQQLGICWGILGTLSALNDLPVVQCSPQELKEKLCGRKNASKVEIQEAVSSKFQVFPEAFVKQDVEHAFDALASIEACLDSEVVRMARSLVE